jgi:hypothetical protein
MTPTIVVLALLALGVGIVIWAVRKKPDAGGSGPREGDTGWNDPVGKVEPPSEDPRP